MMTIQKQIGKVNEHFLDKKPCPFETRSPNHKIIFIKCVILGHAFNVVILNGWILNLLNLQTQLDF